MALVWPLVNLLSLAFILVLPLLYGTRIRNFRAKGHARHTLATDVEKEPSQAQLIRSGPAGPLDPEFDPELRQTPPKVYVGPGTEVFLSVYHLGGRFMGIQPKYYNKLAGWIIRHGAWHVGVYARDGTSEHEWAFWAPPAGEVEGGGIRRKPAYKIGYERNHPFAFFYLLGTVPKTINDMRRLVRNMTAAWPGSSYELYTRNCGHWAKEFAEQQLSLPCPEWVTNLANLIADPKEHVRRKKEYVRERIAGASHRVGELIAGAFGIEDNESGGNESDGESVSSISSQSSAESDENPEQADGASFVMAQGAGAEDGMPSRAFTQKFEERPRFQPGQPVKIQHAEAFHRYPVYQTYLKYAGHTGIVWPGDDESDGKFWILLPCDSKIIQLVEGLLEPTKEVDSICPPQ